MFKTANDRALGTKVSNKGPHQLTIADVESALTLPAKKWRSARVVELVLEKKLVCGGQIEGRWLGAFAKNSSCASKSTIGFCHHSWVQLNQDGDIMDFTRWVFEARDPYLFIGNPKDFEVWPYQVWRQEDLPPQLEIDETAHFIQLKGAAFELVDSLLFGRGSTGLSHPNLISVSREQVRWLASLPTPEFKGLESEVFSSLEKAGFGYYAQGRSR